MSHFRNSCKYIIFQAPAHPSPVYYPFCLLLNPSSLHTCLGICRCQAPERYFGHLGLQNSPVRIPTILVVKLDYHVKNRYVRRKLPSVNQFQPIQTAPFNLYSRNSSLSATAAGVLVHRALGHKFCQARLDLTAHG